MRSRITWSVVPLTLLAFAACTSDDVVRPTGPRIAAAAPHMTLSQAQLDARITALIPPLFPTGLETSTGVRWDSIKDAMTRSLTDPTQLAVAKTQLINLTNYILAKKSTLTAPAGETVQSASTKLILYMAAYVYGMEIDDVPTGPDAGVGIVLPNTDPPPITTQSGHAGVDFPYGAVNEPTIVTIVQNTEQYALCSGPLDTGLCQLPRYYIFDAFPHSRLNASATFGVCHTRQAGLPWDDAAFDDRLRLAHDKPADAANYVSGGTIVDGIEILPLVTATYLNCSAPDIVWAPQSASPIARLRYAMAGAFGRMVDRLSPKLAYAIDVEQGGGLADYFSHFVIVDPVPRSVAGDLPDLTIGRLRVSPLSVYPGGDIDVKWLVRNIGGYPNGTYVTAVLLSTDATLTPGSDLELARGTANAGLGSNSTAQHGQGVTIPANLSPGTYFLGVYVDPDNGITESNETNNYAVVKITVLAPP